MKRPAKVEKVMREFKSKTLHSGKGGPVVKSRKQAIAIALSEAGMSKKMGVKKPKVKKK
jgi:ribosomal protein L21E